MAHEIVNVPGAYDRTSLEGVTGLVWPENRYLQGAELNEMQRLLRGRIRRAGELSARDGDRIAGAELVIDTEAGTVLCTAGRIFASGDVREIAEQTLTDVPMVGEVIVGVRMVTSYLDADQEPSLVGLAPGTEAEGEPGAFREVQSLAWGYAGDSGAGDLYPVYLLRDGVALDQTAPVELSTTTQAIAAYDRDANGSYVVDGCRVAALGKIAGDQVFVISQGVANINGFKRTRSASSRLVVVEEPDLSRIDGETHVFADAGSGTAVIALRHVPLAVMVTALVEKETTETVTHGAAVGSIDALSQDSVTEIIEVTQGATTYVDGADYVLNADRVDWTPGGAEPATGSSYSVTYRYRDAVTPEATSDTTVTLAGGVTGGDVILTYDYKLPRVDRICLDPDGRPVYIKGISSRSRPAPAQVPDIYLPLAEVDNNWVTAPKIINSGVRSYPFTAIDRMYNRLIDALDLIALERLRRDIDSREPVAKRGVFVDPFTSDRYRDAGEEQDAAVFLGSCQLPIDATVFTFPLLDTVMLVGADEVVILQPLSTNCRLINPYKSFDPLPGTMRLSPASDFWTEFRTEWASPVTRQFGSGNATRVTQTEAQVDEREELAEFLRAVSIEFEIEGFGAGENLVALTFDGIDLTPDPMISADVDGRISGTMEIPGGIIPAGEKLVAAEGAGGSSAQARFVGQGEIEVTVMQRITTVTRWQEELPDTWPPEDPGGGGDPLGQTFTLPSRRPRHIGAVDLMVCAKGDEANHLIVELRFVDQGLPTYDVVTQTVVNMSEVTIGEWFRVRFPAPVWLSAEQEWCIVIKTDDDEHALATASIGSFDVAGQRFVTQQPYTVGVMLSSSNAMTWTPHQEEDLTFAVVAARFPVTTRTVVLGTAGLVDCTDLLIRAAVALPTAECSVVFEIVRPAGAVIRLVAGQVVELDERITETVTVRAVLAGTETASPTLFPGVQLIAGSLRDTATYVSRAFNAADAERLPVRLKALLPAGSSVAVEVEDELGAFHAIPLAETEELEVAGWTDRTYEIDPLDPQPDWAFASRIRLTLTGGPAARPSLADLRAAAI